MTDKCWCGKDLLRLEESAFLGDATRRNIACICPGHGADCTLDTILLGVERVLYGVTPDTPVVMGHAVAEGCQHFLKAVPALAEAVRDANAEAASLVRFCLAVPPDSAMWQDALKIAVYGKAIVRVTAAAIAALEQVKGEK